MKLLITTNQGMEEFTSFKVVPDRIQQHVLRFYKNGVEVFSTTISDSNNVNNIVNSIYYTISHNFPDKTVLLIDSSLIRKVDNSSYNLEY